MVAVINKYRIIDFKRNKDGIPGRVATIEYDPNRSANIALINYADGEALHPGSEWSASGHDCCIGCGC